MFFNEAQMLVFGLVFWLFWFGDDLLDLLKKSRKSDNLLSFGNKETYEDRTEPGNVKNIIWSHLGRRLQVILSSMRNTFGRFCKQNMKIENETRLMENYS